ncbi:MAG: hypothetical protein J5I53_09035 [Bradyrhizobiaceae bacterium]|nr:hypothetical protein [Bradyrhizobiaceae bacterium]
MKPQVSPWHVGVAAEAFAAGQFARLGWDVSLQYGANQPGYDLVIVRDDMRVTVSVKGSKDGSWGLTQTQLTHMKKVAGDQHMSPDYHAAIDLWLKKHKDVDLFCFIQFRDVKEHELPRMYIASTLEVGDHLRGVRNGRGDTILHEDHTYKSGYAAGVRDRVPANWQMTAERLKALVLD